MYTKAPCSRNPMDIEKIQDLFPTGVFMYTLCLMVTQHSMPAFFLAILEGADQEPAIPAFSIPIPILRLVLRLVDSDTDTDTRKSENFDSDSDTDTKVKQVLLHRF